MFGEASLSLKMVFTLWFCYTIKLIYCFRYVQWILTTILSLTRQHMCHYSHHIHSINRKYSQINTKKLLLNIDLLVQITGIVLFVLLCMIIRGCHEFYYFKGVLLLFNKFIKI